MILVTGASGFLGRAIAEELGERAVTVGRQASERSNHIVADLTYKDDSLTNELRKYEITHVIHAAAVTPWSEAPDFSLDLAMADTIVGLCNELQYKELFFISGWVVYDAQSLVPFSEDTPIQPTTQYGQSKAAVEKYLSEKLTTTNLLNLRTASVYGPGQTSAGLIPNLVTAALASQQMKLQATNTRRDYLYVADFVRAVCELIDLEKSGNTDINIGSGKSVTVLEVAQTIQEICKATYGLEVSIEVDPEARDAELADNVLAIDRAQNMGLLKHVTPLKTGLEAYMAWSKHESIL